MSQVQVQTAPVITVTRGGIVESQHDAVISVVSAEGKQIAHYGDTELVTFARSSAKPIQAIPVVESGALDAFGFDEADLALFCASHSSELQHTDRVANVLKRIGLDESYLKCGGHIPHSMETYDRLILAGQKPTSLYSNCSGKHSGMLTYTRHTGTDPNTYHLPEHPLQQEIVKVLAELSEVPAEDIVIGTDGCGVPCFAIPVFNWALAMAKYSDPKNTSHGPAMTRIVKAMGAYPELVGGTDRFDTDLMRATSGRIVAKGGAEGFIIAIDTANHYAIAAKVKDGNARGIPSLVIKTLLELNALTQKERTLLGRYEEPVIMNTRQEIVGKISVDVELVRD
ncbi:asparaginase [Alicyclobacillus ferrooxydans]|uniref:Asparaginase n=1 Tax=Alicyclobacillus ferrooxydans TaxID=471514 RepID=A0A0P9CJB8_9BACL|nr:asparaginase [Alicyclobacillus ferrooxydans]KPV45438.1 asparaginase [Alicyclobacillus ferrooxydans]